MLVLDYDSGNEMRFRLVPECGCGAARVCLRCLHDPVAGLSRLMPRPAEEVQRHCEEHEPPRHLRCQAGLFIESGPRARMLSCASPAPGGAWVASQREPCSSLRSAYPFLEKEGEKDFFPELLLPPVFPLLRARISRLRPRRYLGSLVIVPIAPGPAARRTATTTASGATPAGATTHCKCGARTQCKQQQDQHNNAVSHKRASDSATKRPPTPTLLSPYFPTPTAFAEVM